MKKIFFVFFSVFAGIGCSSAPKLEKERVLSQDELEERQKIKEGFRALNKYGEPSAIKAQIAQLECEIAFQELKKALRKK